MWEEFSRHLRVTVLSNIGYSFAYNIFIELIQFIIHNDILRDTRVLNDDLLFLHTRTDIFNNFHRFFSHYTLPNIWYIRYFSRIVKAQLTEAT